MSSRPEIPPPGAHLPFLEWCEVLTVELRFLPEVQAARTGRSRVVWRFAGVEVNAIDDRGTYMIRLGGTATMLAQTSLCDAQRHDTFTAENFARTLADHFDARFSTAASHEASALH
jgi:hypothetical protein